MDKYEILAKIDSKEISTVEKLKEVLESETNVKNQKAVRTLKNWFGYVQANHISDVSKAYALYDSMKSGMPLELGDE